VLGVRLTGSEHLIIARAASRLCAGSYSRRRFLGVAGALLLAGCGRDAARERPPSDAEVLRGLLRRERAAGSAVAGLAGAAAIARQDERHAERLAALAGAGPLARRAEPGADLAAALARKQEAVFAYVEALPRLSDPDHRVLVMQLAASDAEHIAALRLDAGRDPVPDAFAGFTGAPER
jgi:hypothetical protein